MRADHEYRGLMAAAWDLLRGDTSGWQDRPFYRDLIERSGQPALDVGCGTGRLVLDYLRSGIDIDGVDSSPEMLAICREKAASVGLAPAAVPPGDAGARPAAPIPDDHRPLLVVPAGAGPGGRRGRHGAVRRPPGAGRRARDAVHRARPARCAARGDLGRARRSGPEDGATIRRTAWARYDPATQLEETRDRYEVLVDGRVVRSETHERNPATRGYTVEQATALFTAAGFDVDQVVSGLHARAVRPGPAAARTRRTRAPCSRVIGRRR